MMGRGPVTRESVVQAVAFLAVRLVPLVLIPVFPTLEMRLVSTLALRRKVCGRIPQVRVFHRATYEHMLRPPDAKSLNSRTFLAEPCPHNAGVEGSSPSLSTNEIKQL
jgi:hypothetical protein